MPKITKMKLQKISAFLFLLFGSTIASCSDDRDESATAGPIVPPSETVQMVKKITQTTHYGGMGDEVSVTDFSYVGNQLTNTQTVAGVNVYGSTFHYDGDKVTSVDYMQNGSADGMTTFHYDGDLLSYTLSGESQNERTNYTFLDGLMLTRMTYYPTGPDQELIEKSMFDYFDDNLIQETNETYYAGGQSTRSVFTNDDNKNPFRGMNKYLRLVMENEGFNGISGSNPLTKKVFLFGENTPQRAYYYQMEYTEFDQPTSIKRYDSQSNFLISETVIEYVE